MTLAEALALVELEPGRIYRCRVKEFDVEVRVLDENSPPGQVARMNSLLQFMKPFTIEDCDLAPGDLSDAEEDMNLPSHAHEADLPDTSESIRDAKKE